MYFAAQVGIPEKIDYAAELVIGQEKVTNAELARLLHHRLDDQESEQTA